MFRRVLAVVRERVSIDRRACPHCGGSVRWSESGAVLACDLCNSILAYGDPASTSAE